MSQTDGTWLESVAGERFALRGSCSLGRSSSNTVRIEGNGVSRKHAILHAQEGAEWLVADLGSANGTFVNDRRVVRPVKLSDGDRLRLGDATLIFHHRLPEGMTLEELSMHTAATMQQIRNVPCWLLVADIENFTPLSQRLSADELAQVTGTWIGACKEAIERNGGDINKYLGDGFFAYWEGGQELAPRIATTLAVLSEVRSAGQIEFRVVVHCGSVAMGGAATQGEENLMGPAVNLIFRLEKAAATAGAPFSASDDAAKTLAEILPAHALTAKKLPGDHELKGFSGKHLLWRIDSLAPS